MANIPTWRGADTDLSGMARLLAAMPNPGQNLAQNLGDIFSDYQTAQQDRAQLAFDEEKLRADLIKNDAQIRNYDAKTDYKRAQTEYMPKEFDLKQEEARSQGMARDAQAGLNIVNTEDKALELDKKRTEQEEEDFTKNYFSQVAGLEDPNLRKRYEDEFRKRHPDLWKKHTEPGKTQALREAKEAEAHGGARGKITGAFGALEPDSSSTTGGNSYDIPTIPNWGGMKYQEKVDALAHQAANKKGLIGETMLTKTPQGDVKEIPMSVWKDTRGKNEKGALQELMADPGLSSSLGFSDKTKEWFSTWKVWQWGDQAPSNFNTKLQDLPDEDKPIVEATMNLMKFMDPQMVRDLVKGHIRTQREVKKDPKAKVDKYDLGLYLDKMAQQMNSNTAGIATSNPF